MTIKSRCKKAYEYFFLHIWFFLECYEHTHKPFVAICFVLFALHSLLLCYNILFKISKWLLVIYEEVYSIWCHIYLPGVTMNWFISSSWIHIKLHLAGPVIDSFHIFVFDKHNFGPNNWKQIWPSPWFIMICLWRWFIQ